MFSLSKFKASKRRQALDLTFVDGLFTAIMIGTAETFALVFGIKSGLSVHQIGILSTAPILLGAVAQVLVPQRIRAGELRRSILVAHTVQISGLAALLYSVHSSSVYASLLLGLSLYWIGGMISGPLWFDWVAAWLPHRLFSRYLSRRNAFVAVATLGAYAVTALAIRGAEGSHGLNGGLNGGSEIIMERFRWAFWIAIVARLISWGVVFAQPDSPERCGSPSRANRAQNLEPPELWSSKPVLVIVIFTVLFKFAVNVAGPFFVPYMFHELRFTLMPYVWITSVPFIGRFIFLARWGEAAKSIRPFVGLQITMFGIAISPVLWTLTNDIRALSVIEFVSGMMWGGFDLCAILIIQNLWPGSARKLIGIHLALMSVAALGGAALGSWLIESRSWAYSDVFLCSSNLRIVTALVFVFALLRIRENRLSLKIYGDFLTTVLSLGPSLANIARIIPLRRMSRKIPKTRIRTRIRTRKRDAHA